MEKFFKNIAVRICFIYLIFNLLTPSSPIHAQFKINKIEKSQSFYEKEKNNIGVSPILRYNRVQGITLGIDFSSQLTKLGRLDILGKYCYGFKDQSRYLIGLQRSFFNLNFLTIGAYYQDLVTSQDDWFISYNENSAAAFFLKEDFMDYYIKKGAIGFIDQKINEVHTIRFEAESFEYGSIERNTNWSIFGKKKNFRRNSSIPEEHGTAARFLWVFDWRDNSLMPQSGWYIEGKAEQTLGDSVDTKGLFLTLKRFQTLFGSHLIKIKLIAGTRTGCASRYDQYLMDMGGIGSLVAYKDKEFTNGNRFLYGTVHYLFNETVLGRLPLDFIPFYDQLTLGVFAETGWLDFVNEDENLFAGYKTMNWTALKSDVGFSLYVTEGLFRIDFAKRTDRAKESWRITLRAMQKF